MQRWKLYWIHLETLCIKNTTDHLKGFALKLSVRNKHTCVPPSELCQFAHIKRVLSLGCMGDWVCVQNVCTHKMTQPERILSALPLCVYIWMVSVVGRVVSQVWAHESDSRYSSRLNPACSLAWLLWHKVASLLHFILTLQSSFTPSDRYFTSSWSKELVLYLPVQDLSAMRGNQLTAIVSHLPSVGPSASALGTSPV